MHTDTHNNAAVRLIFTEKPNMKHKTQVVWRGTSPNSV